VAVLVLVAIGIYLFARANQPVAPPSPTTNASVSAAPGQWASLGRTPSRVSYDTPAPQITGRIRWSLETSTQIYSSPVAADGRVYLAAGDRRVMAMEAASGRVLWVTTGPVDSTPAIAAGVSTLGFAMAALSRWM
jgi:outer membrane protein assembly factor BamB